MAPITPNRKENWERIHKWIGISTDPSRGVRPFFFLSNWSHGPTYLLKQQAEHFDVSYKYSIKRRKVGWQTVTGVYHISVPTWNEAKTILSDSSNPQKTHLFLYYGQYVISDNCN